MSPIVVTALLAFLAQAPGSEAISVSVEVAAAATAKAVADMAAADTAAAEKCSVPTFTLDNLPTHKHTNLPALEKSQFPQDFCMDFVVTMPTTKSDHSWGYAGVIASMGDVWITATDSSKFFPCPTGETCNPCPAGESCHPYGLMAIVNKQGSGPYFATIAFAHEGEKISASFCYKDSANEPLVKDSALWLVGSSKIAQGTLPGKNKGARFPKERNVDFSVLTGKHKGQSHSPYAWNKITLHSLQFRRYSADPAKRSCAPLTPAQAAEASKVAAAKAAEATAKAEAKAVADKAAAAKAVADKAAADALACSSNDLKKHNAMYCTSATCTTCCDAWCKKTCDGYKTAMDDAGCKCPGAAPAAHSSAAFCTTQASDFKKNNEKYDTWEEQMGMACAKGCKGCCKIKGGMTSFLQQPCQQCMLKL